MDYILLYSLSLLLYQTLYTAEQNRLLYYYNQFVKSKGLDINNLPHHGANRNAVAR